MAYLEINGIEIPVLSSRSAPHRTGEYGRADDGRARTSVQSTRYDWQFATGPLTAERAELLRKWVSGEGHVMSAETGSTSAAWKWTSRGRAPFYSADSLQVTSGAKWGSAFHRVTANYVGWSILVPSTPWTVLVWLRETSGGPWVHWHARSDGTVYRDGVLSARSTYDYLYRAFSPNTVLKFEDVTASGVADFDDMVVFTYWLPDEWIVPVYEFHSAQAWPALPKVWASGDRFADGQLCLVETGERQPWAHHSDGVWQPAGEGFDFTLRETE